MTKRKQPKDNEVLPDAPSNHADAGSDDSGNDDDTVNVDFEWFDPQPEHDFHGLKTLLRQLLDVDAQLFDLSALADLILSQQLLGSTVKVEGNESDPYAFLTVLNLHEHREKQVIKDLTKYLVQKSSTNSTLSDILQTILSLDSGLEIGLILTERVINIPPEVVPPMYTMLLEEIQWALEEKEPYKFSHYLIVSRAYTEVVSTLDQEDNRPQKKNKSHKGEKELFYFHPEDEILQRHALVFGNFEYTNDEGEGKADSKRAFQEEGIRPQGHMILIEGPKFEGAVRAVGEFLSPRS
ncbi:Mss4p nuclear export [Glutinoglossum americanum]|uniref:Protein BCP1 n=1 Tax=Glutinoglossum americanum TaxID=1670608 RepID=A0A9P8IBT8_9PEZI|nr:Mss4p nuclear export [Glutinoglossum americanum]